jgi:hypothetical protein
MNQNELRALVAAALESAGEQELAARAAEPRSTRIVRVLELPGGAVASLFEVFPHAGASFYAGLAAGRVFYLTGAPAAFAGMMRASGLQVTDERTAGAVARGYVETTRVMNTFSTVLDSADDISWDTRPGRVPAPDVVARLRAAVRPPAAVAAGPGRYEVTVFVLRGPDVERRVLTVTTDGAVSERTEDVITGLPVPASM